MMSSDPCIWYRPVSDMTIAHISSVSTTYKDSSTLEISLLYMNFSIRFPLALSILSFRPGKERAKPKDGYTTKEQKVMVEWYHTHSGNNEPYKTWLPWRSVSRSVLAQIKHVMGLLLCFVMMMHRDELRNLELCGCSHERVVGLQCFALKFALDVNKTHNVVSSRRQTFFREFAFLELFQEPLNPTFAPSKQAIFRIFVETFCFTTCLQSQCSCGFAYYAVRHKDVLLCGIFAFFLNLLLRFHVFGEVLDFETRICPQTVNPGGTSKKHLLGRVQPSQSAITCSGPA